jgi:ABC-type antimicrobial peptide transport system permease subunit
MVLRGAFWQVGVGLVIGLPLAIIASRIMTSKLYGVSGLSPLVFGGAVLMLALAAFFAGLLPARRAASIEPMKALRVE